MGTITVITSGKGGVGKSVFTAGLGYALAGRGRRVLLVDCDAGLRSLDYMLGIGEKLVFDLADLVKGSCRPDAKHIVQASQPGVAVHKQNPPSSAG